MDVILGHEGIQALKMYFDNQLATLDKLVKDLELALAEKGLELLESNAPTFDIDGNIAGHAYTEATKSGYRVVYSGEDVAYIEFGTGIMGESNPYPDANALVEANWQYDVNGHGINGWFYKSKRDGSLKHSRGMRPEKPVYDSYKQLEMVAKDIIKGVLNDFFA